MTRRGFFSRAIGCALLALMIPDRLWAAQTAPASAPTLIVAGDVSTPLSLAPAELKTLPRTRVEVKEDGRTLNYEGVLVGEILKRAGVPLGAELRGNAIASYVVASANDGYQVVFSLAELDPAFTSNDIIVADTIDGKPLFCLPGPTEDCRPKGLAGCALDPDAGKARSCSTPKVER